MRKITFYAAAVAFAAATGTVACGGDPPAKTPESVKVPQKTTTTSAPPPSTTPPEHSRVGNIAVSNEILRLCNITLPKEEGPAPKFGFDSADVDEAEKPLLQQIAKCFTTGPLKGRSMRLTGRADPRGETEYNMTLGAKRSSNVKGYLGGLGVGNAQMESTSRGELDATGTDEEGWRKDRRVDIDLIASK